MIMLNKSGEAGIVTTIKIQFIVLPYIQYMLFSFLLSLGFEPKTLALLGILVYKKLVYLTWYHIASLLK